MKKSTAVLWILVFTAILAGTYAKIHNSEIRQVRQPRLGPALSQRDGRGIPHRLCL